MTIVRQLDPVQGLLDYVLDIKPYHTKVIEVLTSYVQTESVEVTMSETYTIDLQIEFPSLFDLEAAAAADGTTDEDCINLDILSRELPFGSPNGWPIISFNSSAAGPFDPSALGYDISSNTIILPGDRTTEYSPGSSLELTIFEMDGTVVDTTIYEVLSSDFVLPTDITTETQHTAITVASLLDPSTSTSSPLTTLCALVTLTPFAIANTIPGFVSVDEIDYTSIEPHFPSIDDQTQDYTPTESNYTNSPVFVNSFVIDGDVSEVFVAGSIVEVVGQTTPYRVLMSTFDGTSTFVRVLETILTNITGELRLRERILGFGDDLVSQSETSGSLSTNIVERIAFSWSDPNETDVINGYQFAIANTIGDVVNVHSASVAQSVSVGDSVRILESPSNDGIYVVTATTESTITLDSQLTDESGGWIEQYEP